MKTLYPSSKESKTESRRPRIAAACWLVLAPVVAFAFVFMTGFESLWLMALSFLLATVGSICIYFSRSAAWSWVLASVLLSVNLTFFGYLVVLIAASTPAFTGS